jgi:phosphoglycolate phosphatase
MHANPGSGENRLGLGERRCDQRREPGPQMTQQRKPFRSSRQRQHLVGTASVPVRRGSSRRKVVAGGGVGSKPGQPLGEPFHQPRRRGILADVDGEVEHARRRGLVAVIARRRTPTRPAHSPNSSAMDNNYVTGYVTAPPQLVIFDLDGTLTDSARGIVSSFRHALGQVGAPLPDDPDLAGRVVGPPMHHTLQAMGLGELADDAIAAYRADYTTRGWVLNEVFDEIPELLEDLRAAGVRLAVATSKAEATARQILAHFGLDGHFDVIAGASLDGVRSTKADVVAHALAQLHPLPEHVLMVGDRLHDVHGASHHGIDTIVVDWGYGGRDFEDPANDRALAHVPTVAALREVLGV